ncbi:hypothetical protein [Lentzea sp. E54]|uniref:hypothetical protein n=1 Tax=Lentzea xerophila TaxID=3435883 RepID=UPI003DA40FF7
MVVQRAQPVRQLVPPGHDQWRSVPGRGAVRAKLLRDVLRLKKTIGTHASTDTTCLRTNRLFVSAGEEQWNRDVRHGLAGEASHGGYAKRTAAAHGLERLCQIGCVRLSRSPSASIDRIRLVRANPLRQPISGSQALVWSAA